MPTLSLERLIRLISSLERNCNYCGGNIQNKHNVKKHVETFDQGTHVNNGRDLYLACWLPGWALGLAA